MFNRVLVSSKFLMRYFTIENSSKLPEEVLNWTSQIESLLLGASDLIAKNQLLAANEQYIKVLRITRDQSGETSSEHLSALHKIAQKYEEIKDFRTSIIYYKKLHKIHEKLPEKKDLYFFLSTKIASLTADEGDHIAALNYLKNIEKDLNALQNEKTKSLYYKTLSQVSQTKTFLESKKKDYELSALKSAKVFEKMKYSNELLRKKILKLDNEVINFNHYPELLSSLKNSFYRNIYSYDCLVALFWILTRKNCRDQAFLSDIATSCSAYIKSFNMSEISYFLLGCSKGDFLTEDWVKNLNLVIKKRLALATVDEFEKFIMSYNNFYREIYEDFEIFQLIESVLWKYIDKLSMNSILFSLKVLSMMMLRYPTDMFTRVSPKIIEKLHEANPKSISHILSVYSSHPAHYQYQDIFNACSNMILSNPKIYFNDSKVYVTIIHTYSKIDKFPKILKLYPIYLPNIPYALLQHAKSLSIFLYSVLRSPPNLEYENMALKVLFESSDNIPEIYKKKMITALIKRESKNQFFWDNVKLLNVFWTSEEIIYISDQFPILNLYGLIRD